jgi:hypothetical protein
MRTPNGNARTTGLLTVWAKFPNPDNVLVPGLNDAKIGARAFQSRQDGARISC